MIVQGERRVALVTGANKGIGFETVRQLAANGCSVLLGSRDAAKGASAVERLGAEGVDVRALPLDVTDPRSIANAAAWIGNAFGRLDILVNNAGVLLEGDFGKRGAPRAEKFPKPSSVPLDVVKRTFETNTFGAIAVTTAMLPLLRNAPAARIVTVSSRLSSLTAAAAAGNDTADDGYLSLLAYNSSKTALNSAMLQLAVELRDTPIKLNLADPGHCATDINGYAGDRGPEEAARIVVRLALLAADGPTGRFIGESGETDW